ncbi:MAG TPA: F0F1 ATP synthase subunit delta [Anaeromyxobacteraceae bacterium]|nr:F0F1 ATP synthase subunit delta [Anaeromyxobacteraceae bacterium]
MVTGSIARRYAKALFSLALESARVEQWADALLALKGAVASSPELRDVLENPVYSKEHRRAVMAALAERLALDPAPTSLLALLADRNRLAHLSALADHFRDLADAHLGRIRAKVTSAVPLPDEAAQAIALRLAGSSGAKVLLDQAVDPELLGGVVAQVGSLVYDGSLRAQLRALRRTLGP